MTKEFVRAEVADVRTELHTGLADVRTEMAEFRGEVRAEFASVRGEIAQLEGRMNERFREMTMWIAGALIAGLGASAGIGAGIAVLAG